jgi:predicted amidohydrolase
MKIALIQQHASADKVHNLRRGLAAARAAAQNGAEVLCFAELAFERFYPQVPADQQDWAADARDLAESIPGPTTQAFQSLAAELGVVIVLNLYERDGAQAFDTSPVIDADGKLLGRTRMVHITDYEAFHESGYYNPGDCGAPIYQTRFGKFGIAICYDRHYPEYMRALTLAGAEVIFVPQAGALGEWPDGLYEAELQVTAFQNGVFTALCNRVGEEERLTFAGESFVCNPSGCVVARAGTGTDETLHVDLDLSEVAESHAQKLFLRDRRPELYGPWLS